MLKVPDSKDRVIAEQAEQIANLEGQLEQVQGQLGAAQSKIAELEAQLGQNSTNSSRPPSSDPPELERPKKGKKGRKRKRGAQPGHEPHRKELLPEEKVTRVVPVLPERCERCDNPLSGRDPSPTRHQVIEVPPIVPDVTEYQCHRLQCDECGHTSRAPLPKGVPTTTFGARLCAIVGVLTGRYRLAKRAVPDLLSDLLGISMSVGSVCNIEKTVSGSLQEPTDECGEFVKDQSFVHQDETSWRESNQKAWLWTAVTTAVVVFHIAGTRAASVAKKMLGTGFAGILISDRYSAYTWVASSRRQLCWSHLVRDFQAMVDRGGKAEVFGSALLVYERRIFRWWHRVRDGTLKRETFQRRMVDIKRSISQILRDASVCPDVDKKTRGTCKQLLKLETAFWTFVDVEGIEPTNNDAERELRHAVLWRKGSFGTQSEAGSRYVERILTTVGTLRRQSRHVLDYLTVAVQAHFEGTSAPSLLPPQQD